MNLPEYQYYNTFSIPANFEPVIDKPFTYRIARKEAMQLSQEEISRLRRAHAAQFSRRSRTEPVPPPAVPPPETQQESSIFSDGGLYSWLPDAYRTEGHTINDRNLVDWGQNYFLPINSDHSDNIFEFTPGMVTGNFICNDATAPWGEHGPKWFIRMYNTKGIIENLVVWRVGDFTSGREGHVLYLDACDTLKIKNFTGIQHGAQLLQLVFRPSTTTLPMDAWPINNPDAELIFENLTSIDGGVINQIIDANGNHVYGNAIRASWPLSIFNPGHSRLKVDGFKVRCNHPEPFQNSGQVNRRSHGGILTAPGDSYFRGKHAQFHNLDIQCANPDRELVRAWGWDEFIIHSGKIVTTDDLNIPTPSANIIRVVGDVRKFEIKPEVEFQGRVEVYAASSPYKNTVATFQHFPGQHLNIEPSRIAS